MSDMSFTWKGVSSDEYGVVVTGLPAITTPQARDEAFPVPGRSGALHIRDGAYEETLLMISGYLPYEQGAEVAPIETIKSWLTGAGDLTLSDLPNRRYRARIIDAVAFSPLVAAFQDRVFQAGFWCDPLMYSADPEGDEERLVSPRSVYNPGTAEALPVITVYGTGDVTLTVGDVTVSLDGMTAPVAIDSEAHLAYIGTVDTPVSITLEDHLWPTLPVGDTRVSWTGSVSRVIIEPNWRWV